MAEIEKYRYIIDPQHAWVHMVVRRSDNSKLGIVWQTVGKSWWASSMDWHSASQPEGATVHASKKQAAGFLDALQRAAAAEYTPGQKLFWLLADGTRRGGVVESRHGETLVVAQGPEGDRTSGVRIAMEDVAREMFASALDGLPVARTS